MSNGVVTDEQATAAYYDYLKSTVKLARCLTENLIFMQETGLASTANLLRLQLQQMADQVIDGQLAAIPQPDFSA